MTAPMTHDATLPTSRLALLDRAAWLLAGAVAWSVVVLAAWLRPDARGFGTHQQLGLPPCSFEAMTHVPCPGCGLTTSFARMAHLHVIDAFRAHLMGPPLFLLTLAVALAAPLAVRRGWPVMRALSFPWLTACLGVTLALGMITFSVRLAHRFL